MLTLVSQSSFTALAVSDIMTHLNVTDTTQEPYITSLLNAAVVYCERHLNMDLRPTTWNEVQGQFPIWANYSWGDRWGNAVAVWPFISEFAIGRSLQRWQEIVLPRGPLTAQPTITYYDVSNNLQTLATNQYAYTQPSYMPARIEPVTYWPISYPRPDAVTIQFQTGYTASNIPASILHAIKLLCGNWFNMREDISYGPETVSGATGQAVECLLGGFKPGLYA